MSTSSASETQWLLSDEDIPSSFPVNTPDIPADQTPVILIVGSGRHFVHVRHPRAQCVSRAAIDIQRGLSMIKPIGAILIRGEDINPARPTFAEDNLASSILSALGIPFATGGSRVRRCGKTSTTLEDAPYFDIGVSGEHLDVVIDYLLAVSKPVQVSRRRGISRARL